MLCKGLREEARHAGISVLVISVSFFKSNVGRHALTYHVRGLDVRIVSKELINDRKAIDRLNTGH